MKFENEIKQILGNFLFDKFFDICLNKNVTKMVAVSKKHLWRITPLMRSFRAKHIYVANKEDCTLTVS